MTNSAEVQSSSYTKPLPRISPLNAPYWSYARKHELRFQCCKDCSHWIYPISPVCQTCWSENHEWKPVSGRGKVTSWVTYHKAFEESFRADLPYTVIQVDLEEGIRLISNFIDKGSKPAYEMPVQVAFDDITPDVTLVKFRPAAASVTPTGKGKR